MLKSIRIRSLVLYISLVILISVLIYVPVTLGLADNSDFNRTMRAFGLTSSSGIKYWSADYLFKIAGPASIWQYFIHIFLPVTGNPAEYYSTQFIFTKIALFLNALGVRLLHQAPDVFHLVFQTVQYIGIYALAFFLFMKEKWRPRAYADLAVKAVFALIFLDCGYLVYFNSLYGEPTTLIFLLLSFVLLLYLEKNKTAYWVYGGLILSLLMFSGSKSANFPSALLLCVPLVYAIIRKEGRKKKIILCTLIAAMLGASYGYVRLIPDWMKNSTTFQSVFYGVLYDNPSPGSAVRELGLPRELAGFESMTAYNWASLSSGQAKDTDFQTLFFDRISQTGIMKYYLAHPAFFAEKLDMSAEAALPLRPTYLANVHLPSQQADLIFDNRMNVWESIRKQFSGCASVFFGLILVLSVINVGALLRTKAGTYRILLRLALLGGAAGQFLVPILNNGNADLQKHMFLFNVHFDLLIIVLLLDNLDLGNRIFKWIGGVTAALLLAISFYSSKPETLSLGHQNGHPIQWYVLEKKNGWTKVIAKDALFRSAYGTTSNDYTQSGIQDSLNAKMDIWFTQQERARIRHSEYEAIASEATRQQADAGDRPHYWFSPIKYAAQDSGRAFRHRYSAYLTLPSVDDAERLFRLSKSASVLPVDYWLSTPYYSSTDQTRMVSSDYQVYSRKVDAKLGVRPVMWVRQ
ncbi:hypothetical protein F4V43_07375 [Paenibacillus spiritus]|uniref:DUF6273 domain-containing protein n=1 Tax=Paenibacillus spiritus TaxID=2496557 RepID=A0A5J5GEJ2_9BACL|nr:DUF6273 domain-containing protein [Paenibacillus spiritus]KAA9005884.1 hypothetical protein F4V43_07375 [Paenibacillus spiritus]